MKTTNTISAGLYLTPSECDEMRLKDRTVVVIDVLRASTTVAKALQSGAKEIIPVSSLDSVVKISSSLFGDVTLRAGERSGKMIEGFNLGNSPLEYTEDVVKGKSIIFMTTNGTGAMLKGRYARTVVVASFVNLSVVTELLLGLQSDFVIICAGHENRFCLEDALAAGKLLNRIATRHSGELVLDDAGRAAVSLDRSLGKNLDRVLKSSEHGRFLAELGFERDLEFCAAIDSVPVLPLMAGNVIKLAKENGKRS